MARFRVKPVEVEAIRLTSENFGKVKAWCRGVYWSTPPLRAVTGVLIPTSGRQLIALFGDWVIKGFGGEFYVLADETFRATHDAVEVAVSRAEIVQEGQ